MTGFERLVDEAWPAPYREEFDGWRLRYADGVTKRANSVWAAGSPQDPAKAIEAAENFYAERGLPAVFTVSRASCPAELGAMLAVRGYTAADPTLVMTAALSREHPPAEQARSARVTVSDRPSAEWLDLWWSVDGRYESGKATATEIVTGVPSFYATAGEHACAGVGRSVLQGDWLGISCMAVAPPARRRGLARDVLHALLDHGRAQGAHRAYLCVTEQNTAARALYEQAGFEISGAYHYQVQPLPVRQASDLPQRQDPDRT